MKDKVSNHGEKAKALYFSLKSLFLVLDTLQAYCIITFKLYFLTLILNQNLITILKCYLNWFCSSIVQLNR